VPLPEPDWLQRALRREADLAFRRRVRTVLEYLEPQGDDRILDVGCGRGFYLNFLSRLTSDELYGLDLDPAVVSRARQNLPPSVQIVRGDATALPFADAFFGSMIMSEILEHLPRDNYALAEAYRVLRPGGVLAITVPYRDYPFWWDPINKTREILGRPPLRGDFWGGIWAQHERLYGEEELLERVRGAGFEVLDVRRFTHYCFPFTHNIVYGLGKHLLERGWLPLWLSGPADRFHYADAPARPWNPLVWGLALFDLIDRLNDRADDFRTYVNIAAKARRPL
jgi:SAM-dependent methyltransferase